MAPRTIAIRKNTNGVDPISPIPVRVKDFPKSSIPTISTRSRNHDDKFFKSANQQGLELDELKSKYEQTKAEMEEMKRQKTTNNKRLLEMSGLVKSLQAIPVNYDKTKEGNNFTNVQRKIDAIMHEMNEAKKRYDELKTEKFSQKDTIRAQELQIQSMDQHIALLKERLQREEVEQTEMQKQQIENQTANTEDLEQQVMLQEMEIMNLMAEIDQLKKGNASSSAIGREIKLQEANNAAKYAEIQKMEAKLASMKVEQDAQKMRQAEIVRQNTKEQSEFVISPTETIVAEINKLEDDIGNLRLAQEKKITLESSEKLKLLPPPNKPNPGSIRSKSQPWNRDLEWNDNLNKKKTELEVVTNNDIAYEESVDSESINEEQGELAIPTLGAQKRNVRSVRKKKKASAIGVSDRSVSSENSKSLDSIAEEKEMEAEEMKTDNIADKNNSDTSATVESYSTAQSESQSVSSKVSQKSMNIVELMQSDDGSVELVSCSRPELKGSMSNSSDDETASGSSCSDDSSHEEVSNDGSSNASSSGIFSSDSSAQSSSRSILEQIPEGLEGETDDSGSEWDGEKSQGDQQTKDHQVGSLSLRKQLKGSESKYTKLKDDYNQLITRSQIRVDKLEEENRKLRQGQAEALNSMAKDSEEDSRVRTIKQENAMLLKSMEKQNHVMAKQNRDYEKLQKQHSDTLAKLEEKGKRYDQLILDFSNLANNGKTSQDYNRLKALHESVVMKLADISEENERLEKERDEAIDQIENKDVQIRAYDECMAALKKTEYDLKSLEDVHKDTVTELQELSGKNKELTDKLIKASNNKKSYEKLQGDCVKAKTEMDMLLASNKEFKGIEEKLNASEVKVTMLEEEAKKTQQKLLATKKRSSDRAGQLRDVIAQYKSLKKEYSDKCETLARLELASDGLDNDKGIKVMKAMEEDLGQAKKDASEAIAGKEARENDLKIVLNHYEKLQKKYEMLKLEVDSANEGIQEEKKEDNEASGEEEKKKRGDIENLERLLNESKESMSWKDDKIAKTLTELKEAKEQIEILEKEKKELEVELSEVKSNVLLYRKETENAVGRQTNGQDRLRTAITKHHQLQQVYDSLLKKFGDTTAELQRAKNDMKVKEQEEKHARKRATAIHSQYKKLQEDHDVVVQRLEKLKVEMTTEQTEY